MEMMLRAGTASVPSSASGNGTFSPAKAFNVVGDDKTGAGSVDCALGSSFSVIATGVDHHVPKIAARVKICSAATKIRPAISRAMPERRANLRVASGLSSNN